MKRRSQGWARPGLLFLAATLALAPAVTKSAHAAERPLTLEEAILFALEKNEDIFIEREVLRSADSALTQARGAYDPLFELETLWRQTTEPVNSAFSGAPEGELAPTREVTEAAATLSKRLSTGAELGLRARSARASTDASFDLLSPAWDSRLGVELRQPLLRGRAIDPERLALRVAAADQRRALASLHREVIDTVAAVEQAFWMLLATRREVEVRDQAVGLAEEQLGETQIRIEGGTSPETEIAQPRAELERRRGELLAAREAVSRAENALKLLILSDTDETWWSDRLVPVADLEVTVTEVDVAAAMSQALAMRAELEAAQAVVERRQAETDLARDQVRPGLDLVVSYDRFGLAGSRNPLGEEIPGLPIVVPEALEGDLDDSFETLAEGEFDDARIGFVLSVPLGNRAARAAVEIAESSVRQAEALLTRERKTVRAQVLDAAATLETADGRIQAARAARAAAEVQLEAEKERFAAGLSTTFLVLTRQNDLSRARLDELAAITDYRVARTALGRATGKLLDEHGIEAQPNEAQAP